MAKFDEYSARYQTVKMERQDGILLMTLHTDGKELRWGALPHSELPNAFRDVAGDRDNRVVILTGTGSEFSGPRPTPGGGTPMAVRSRSGTTSSGKAATCSRICSRSRCR